MILVASDCMIPSVGAIHCCRSQAARVNVDPGAAQHLAQPHDEKRHRRRRRAIRRRHHLTRVEPSHDDLRGHDAIIRTPRPLASSTGLEAKAVSRDYEKCSRGLHSPRYRRPGRGDEGEGSRGNGWVSLRRARAARHPEGAQAGRSPAAFPCCLGPCPKRMSHPAL